MSNLDALLEGIVADPANEVRWQVLADWLEEFDDPRRGELARLHLKLRQTCTQPEQHPERDAWHGRMMELMRSGVRPCVPTRTLTLPGDVELRHRQLPSGYDVISSRTLMLPGNVELRLAFIPPGTFLMGSPPSGIDVTDEEPLHEVTLTKGFFLGVHPVTQVQWRAVMNINPSRFPGGNLPVDSVSWNDTQLFFERLETLVGLTLRLPTEAEWEYAARAGTTTPYYSGDTLSHYHANCTGAWPTSTPQTAAYPHQTTVVGTFEVRLPHPWGLADLYGNVREWCLDRYDPQFYSRRTVRNPVCRNKQFRSCVLRGGSWNDHAKRCHSAYRYHLDPSSVNNEIGFRVVFCRD